MNKEKMKAELTKLREANEHMINNINKLAKTIYEDMYSKNMDHTKQLIKELEETQATIDKLKRKLTLKK